MEKRGRERKAASIIKEVATAAAELNPVGASWRQGGRRGLEWHPLQGEVAQVFMHQVPPVMVKGSLVAFPSQHLHLPSQAEQTQRPGKASAKSMREPEPQNGDPGHPLSRTQKLEPHLQSRDNALRL